LEFDSNRGGIYSPGGREGSGGGGAVSVGRWSAAGIRGGVGQGCSAGRWSHAKPRRREGRKGTRDCFSEPLMDADGR
ncbi:MAG: hypothetical protein ACKPHU_27085, partial [Planctomycetaceae bacterium]